MASVLDILSGSLGSGGMEQIGSQLGIGQDQLSKALPSAVAVLTGGLARNSASPDGVSGLASALDRDHDGSILDDLGGFLGSMQGGGGSKAHDGAGILRHVLGGDSAGAAQALGQSSGIDAGQAGNLLKMLAPLLMGALGKAKRQDNLGIEDLGGMLRQQNQQTRGALPSGLGGLAASFLDADGDGDIKDDVARMGVGMLGKLFGRK